MKLVLNPLHGTFDYVGTPTDFLPALITAQLQNGAGQLFQVYDPFTATHKDLDAYFLVTDANGYVIWAEY